MVWYIQNTKRIRPGFSNSKKDKIIIIKNNCRKRRKHFLTQSMRPSLLWYQSQRMASQDLKLLTKIPYEYKKFSTKY